MAQPPAALRHEAEDKTLSKAQTLQSAASIIEELKNSSITNNKEVIELLVLALQAERAAHSSLHQAHMTGKSEGAKRAQALRAFSTSLLETPGLPYHKESWKSVESIMGSKTMSETNQSTETQRAFNEQIQHAHEMGTQLQTEAEYYEGVDRVMDDLKKYSMELEEGMEAGEMAYRSFTGANAPEFEESPSSSIPSDRTRNQRRPPPSQVLFPNFN